MNQTQIVLNIIAVLKQHPFIKSCIIASYRFSDPEGQVKYSIQLAHINESPIIIFSSDSYIRYTTDTCLLESDLKLIELQSLQINIEQMLKYCEPIVSPIEESYKYIRSEHV